MKTRKRKRIERIAIWLMTVIVAINYSVTIALAAEGIGQEELPEKETSSEVATVQVQVNPDALVDAAIYQTNSGVRPLNGTLPVGAVTVNEIPVLASVSLSVDAEAFAEKCAALQVEQYDPAWVFDAGYRSALRQNEATAFAWQEAAAMLDGVAVLNDSDRLVTLVVIPVQTGEEVALAPEEAVLVAGEPLEAELSGETQTPADESGADQEETSGSQDETETTDPSEETSSDEDTGESSSEEESQEPPEGGETEESEPSSSEEQPTEEEDFSGEEGTTEGTDGMDEENPADEGAGMDEEESESQNDPQEEEESEPEPESDPEPEPEPEETGEGSVEANAGRESHVVFYETAGDDAELTVDQGTEEPNEPQEEPEKEQKPEEPAPQPEQPAGDGQNEPQESDTPETDAPETDGADEPEDGTQTGETEPLPEEAIQQSESSVVVMNARPMGGVMMSFRATAPAGFSGEKITITGELTSLYNDGLNGVYFWCIEAKDNSSPHYAKYYPVTANTTLGHKYYTGVAGWTRHGPFSANSDTLEILFLKNKSATFTFYLAEIPPSGYEPYNEPIGKLEITSGKPTFTPLQGLTQGAAAGTYRLTHKSNDGGSGKYKQFAYSGEKDPMMMEGQEVYCFNEKYLRPYTQDANAIVKPVRYLKTAPDESKDLEHIKWAMQYGYSGDFLGLKKSDDKNPLTGLYASTQQVVWYYTELYSKAQFKGKAMAIFEATKKGAPPKPDNKVPEIRFELPDNNEVILNFDEKSNRYISGPIVVNGNFNNCTIQAPDGITIYKDSPDGDILASPNQVASVLEPGTVIHLTANESLALPAKMEANAVVAWTEEDVGQLHFYEPVNQFVTEKIGNGNIPEKYQSLIGYDLVAKTETATASFTASTNETPVEDTAALTLKKVAAEKNDNGSDKLLEGAEFTLRWYNNNAWVPVNDENNPLKTGQDGQVTMTELSLDVPYMLTETKAPDGYNKLASSVTFMLAKENDVISVYQVNEDMTRGGLWTKDAQNITVAGPIMTVPNVKPEEPVRSLKLHLDHLVQEGYNSAYDNLVNGTDFKFALVKDGAVVATGVSHGQKDDVTWSTGGDTVDISEGTYYLLGYNVEQPFQRVVHVYQEARNTDNQLFDPSFAGTAEASGGELREAASLVGGTPFMGVRINVTDADMTAYNGGTLYYHAESNLPMGRLTVNKTYYNRTYRNANDEFQFEVRKLGSRTDTFDQGTYYQTVTVRAGDGKQEINLPYGIYAIRETGMPSRYSFNLFASGAGVTYNPAENFARFSFPRSLLDEGAVNPANEWQVTVTAENRVHSNDRDDDDDDNYRSDGSEEGGGGGGGGGSDPGRSLFNHDDLVNIPEEAVPLTDKPLVEIPDEDVPLGALPNTGGFSMGVFAVLGAAITAIGVFLRKGKKSEA